MATDFLAAAQDALNKLGINTAALTAGADTVNVSSDISGKSHQAYTQKLADEALAKKNAEALQARLLEAGNAITTPAITTPAITKAITTGAPAARLRVSGEPEFISKYDLYERQKKQQRDQYMAMHNAQIKRYRDSGQYKPHQLKFNTPTWDMRPTNWGSATGFMKSSMVANPYAFK